MAITDLLERNSKLYGNEIALVERNPAQGLSPVRKKRGRPKGSKNKKTLEREAASISNNQQ